MASFEAFVRERGDDLLRLAYVLSGQRTDAQDVVQEALTRALERWDRVSRADDPYAYLRRMVVNANISRWRSTLRREVPHPEIADARTIGDHADAHALWQACLSLPSDQSIAVILRYYEGLPYAEIAELVGCAEATARSRVARALSELRTELEREV